MVNDQPIILMIETSTSICSVSLFKAKELLAIVEIEETNAHSSKLSLMIEEVMEKASLKYSDLNAISVSKGPGSYTGLRIGVSSAKGLAYSLDIPLISIETLKILHIACMEKYPNNNTIPMIDARRMEVYSIIYDKEGKEIKNLSADIIEKGIYEEYLNDDEKYIIIGDGAEKCKDVFAGDKRMVFDSEIKLSSKYMGEMSLAKYLRGEFEDTAYFEPYYLKNFIAAPSKVKGLYS